MRVAGVVDGDRWRVVVKPAGVRSEDVAAAMSLRLVHRIDAATSGLLIVADDARTVQRLQRALREGRVRREYVAVAHGVVGDGRWTTTLVRDRGDGLRGTGADGKHAALAVRALQCGPRATLCEVVLDTGRTHQVRIQLAEAGHPVVGERVYVRDHRAAGRAEIPSPRLLLHARALTFVDPTTKRVVAAVAEPDAEFTRATEAALT